MVEVHGGPLLWSVVTFLLLLFVLKRVAWGPIISALETRENEIKEALNSAANARADAEKATADYESIKKEAQSEAQNLLSEAKAMKDKMILEAVQEAKIKADAELKNALELIDAEKAKAVKEIKTVVVDLSIQAASKLIDKNLDNADNKKFINETIDEIGQAK
ncbi:F0F1 ATP synthase subunit B [Candidatus Marinimicrobia bacterium]|jgi:F-type H+-transporting ATPase subunit b|nr:F0F1 ATP synthase subunit B [Candidatus Neomarinimicrobiota bacterium]|tara:strand:+ start:2788 stop:3276 length:489 start_codon:yes stop_codon:yes gene_type:complete